MATPRIDTTSRFQGQRGPNGFRLCRQCGAECPNARRTYCSNACSDQWALERWPNEQRRAVFARDKGVCETCGVDAHRLGERVTAFILKLRDKATRPNLSEYYRRIKAGEPVLPPRRRLAHIQRAGLRLERIIRRFHRKWTFSWSFYVPNSFWEMDHRIPLAEDGTNSLDNLRTLCCACHRAETKALAARLAAKRKEAVND